MCGNLFPEKKSHREESRLKYIAYCKRQRATLEGLQEGFRAQGQSFAHPSKPHTCTCFKYDERVGQGSCEEAGNDLNFTAEWVGTTSRELVSGTPKKLQLLCLCSSSSQLRMSPSWNPGSSALIPDALTAQHLQLLRCTLIPSLHLQSQHTGSPTWLLSKIHIILIITAAFWGCCLGARHRLSHLALMPILGGGYYYSHFTDEETWSQKG